MNEKIDENDDYFFENLPQSISEVKLSHLNNKSSVLCTKSRNITEQYLTLQQLDAHQHMISRAKGIVDTSAPQSVHSYLSVLNRKKKSQWVNQSKSSNFNQKSTASLVHIPSSEEEDNISINASSVSKAVQTGPPYLTTTSKTADKISWYLEALSQGAIPFMIANDSQYGSQISEKNSSARRKKVINGDIVETHTNCFLQSKKPFSPRLLANNSAKSKIKDMRCYNPPFRRKKRSSTNSSDTFESYSDEDEKEKEEEKEFEHHSDDIETQLNRKHSREYRLDSNSRLHNYLSYQNKEKFELSNPPSNVNRNEDKYLDFLNKVTEDILRSGVYSDRAIQQAFEFHMQFYEEAEEKDKLQSLLVQVLDNLKISSIDSDTVPNQRDSFTISLSRSNTPPEKEVPTSLSQLANSHKSEDSSQLPYVSNSEELSNKNSPRHTFTIPET